jgi:hypothetical protein
MRHLRPFPALIALVLVGAACSSPGASSAGQSQAPQQSQGGSASQAGSASQGGSASQPAASAGGGGGGGGANGSIHYEISGDLAKSGDLPFFSNAAVSTFANGGWVAYFYTESDPNVIIQINSAPGSNIFNYGDGTSLVIGTDALGCTFDYSRNDAGGLKGTIDCATVMASNVTSGATLHVKVHATVDAHT